MLDTVVDKTPIKQVRSRSEVGNWSICLFEAVLYHRSYNNQCLGVMLWCTPTDIVEHTGPNFSQRQHGTNELYLKVTQHYFS